MSSILKRIFTNEYRAEAVKLVTESNLGITVAALKLGVSVKTFSHWVRQAKAGKLATIEAPRSQPAVNCRPKSAASNVNWPTPVRSVTS